MALLDESQAMSWRQWLLVAAALLLLTYASLILTLMVAGRREDARAVAGFVPDCLILVRRLLGDARVPRRHKLMLFALAGYLASPVDLVPDFIPVAGQLDDAIVLGLALRAVLRASGPSLLREHWPGPDSSLRVLLRLTARDANAEH